MGSFDIDKLLSELEQRTGRNRGADAAPASEPPAPAAPAPADADADVDVDVDANIETDGGATAAQPEGPSIGDAIAGSPNAGEGPNESTSPEPLSVDSRDDDADAELAAETENESPTIDADVAAAVAAEFGGDDDDDEPTEPAAAQHASDATALAPRPAGDGAGGSANPIVRAGDAALQHRNPDERLKALLIAGEIAQARQIKAAETVVRQSPGANLLDLLIDQGVDERALMRTTAQCRDLTYHELPEQPDPNSDFDSDLVGRLGAEFCKEHTLLPLKLAGGRLTIATAHPEDVFALDEVRLRLGVRSLRVAVTPGSSIRSALEAVSAPEQEALDVESILSDIDEDDVRVEKSESDAVDLEKEAGESPVIRYVNYIIQQAVKDGASDIHIEPGDKTLKVRFRVDGILFEAMQPPAKMAAAITSRLKIMANLDISERRVPQDGRIRCTVQGRKLDLRMSTLPTASGHEKTVMRILDTKSIQVELDDLGFDQDTLTRWKRSIDQPHGIVLVTGPTGSGKTTTLYSSLRQMDKKTKNISTVEDPVEYHLDGVTQTQMHDKIGMTFAKALKALLRQDPDVIMLGEIRDIETATIAIQASLTGHLVLSTLHTNDAPSAVTRLGNIGVEGFLIGAALNAVLAQRLVRRVCKHCVREAEMTEEMQEFLEMQGIALSDVVEGAGCDRCRNLGYSGRLGIYELLTIDDHLRDVIARSPNVTEFRRMCVDRGMVTLREDGFRKVRDGHTTPQEVLRVTESTI